MSSDVQYELLLGIEQADDATRRLLAAEFAGHSLAYFYNMNGGEGSPDSQTLSQVIEITKRFFAGQADLLELAQARTQAWQIYLKVASERSGSAGVEAAHAVYWATTDLSQTAAVQASYWALEAARLFSPESVGAMRQWQLAKLKELVPETKGTKE